MRFLCLCSFGLFVYAFPAIGQETLIGGWQSEFAYTVGLGKGWKVNGKILGDLFLLRDVEGDRRNTATILDLNQFEYSVTGSKSFSPFFNVAFGYLYGDVTPFAYGTRDEHRFFQQVTFSQLLHRIRLSEQIKFEERIFSTGYRSRLRIKVAVEIPLQGVSLDPGEWYIISSNEALLDLRSSDERNAFYTENRFQLSFGKLAVNKNKFEYGFGYHRAAMNQLGDREHYLYLRTGFFISQKLNSIMGVRLEKG